MNRRPAPAAKPGVVRLIAGQWRGSKLPVLDRPGLRPSADRVRETLFNWLQQHIAGRRVLDLFAGTGALGFEAASRGAAEVVLVERDPELADSLRASAARLQAAAVRVERADALAWLTRPADQGFDLVFVDPPFALNLWDAAAQALVPWLAAEAWVYVESAVDREFRAPPGWQLHRQGQTREVCYALYRVQAADSAATLPPVSSERTQQQA